MIIKFELKDLQNNWFKINQIFKEEKIQIEKKLIKRFNFNSHHWEISNFDNLP